MLTRNFGYEYVINFHALEQRRWRLGCKLVFCLCLSIVRVGYFVRKCIFETKAARTKDKMTTFKS